MTEESMPIEQRAHSLWKRLKSTAEMGDAECEKLIALELTEDTPTPAADEVEAAAKLKPQYPDYVSDADGLARFRDDVRTHRGHDMAVLNHNSLGRLIDTIDRLRLERDAAIAALQARSAEPAGMMDAAWEAYQNTGIDMCADSDDETRKCVENAVRAALKAATPTNPERLVEALRTYFAAKDVLDARVNGHANYGDLGSAASLIDAERELRSALSAAPLKEGQGE